MKEFSKSKTFDKDVLPKKAASLLNEGDFSPLGKKDVVTICSLAGWSKSSGAWTLYVKEIFERHLDTSGLIYR